MGGEAQEFLQGFALFDEKMKKDALVLWGGLRGAENGFGLESVLEVDLQGSLPTVPKVPDAIIEKGVAPRISVVRPVTDREKLQQSWKEIEGAAANLLKTASQEFGEKIPMQKPMSSQSDGLKTWFYPIPMQTDDFVPSVTLNDKFAVFSTSKNHAIEMAEAASKAPEAATGLKVDVTFAPLQQFLQGWLQLANENPEIFSDEEMRAAFLEEQEDLARAVKALEEFESWSLHTRMDDGEMRTSTFLKTK
jgi:hypothetical protein